MGYILGGYLWEVRAKRTEADGEAAARLLELAQQVKERRQQHAHAAVESEALELIGLLVRDHLLGQLERIGHAPQQRSERRAGRSGGGEILQRLTPSCLGLPNLRHVAHALDVGHAHHVLSVRLQPDLRRRGRGYLADELPRGLRLGGRHFAPHAVGQHHVEDLRRVSADGTVKHDHRHVDIEVEDQMRARAIERRRWRNKGRKFFALHQAVTIQIDLTNQCVTRLLVETGEAHLEQDCKELVGIERATVVCVNCIKQCVQRGLRDCIHNGSSSTWPR